MTTTTALCCTTVALLCSASREAVGAEGAYSWNAPDRRAKVAELIPGRHVPMPPPQTFLKASIDEQAAKWRQAHPDPNADPSYDSCVAAEPGDEALAAYVPDHISPFAIVLEGKPDPDQAADALITYCPLCGARGRFTVDAANAHHATMSCCRQDLYEREEDYPAGFKLRPNSVAHFQHLDDTVKEVPGYTFTDARGVKWQLFIGTLFAHERWLHTPSLVEGYLGRFRDTGDPVAVHKLAVLLDRVADVYHGLPFSYRNELATDASGKPLTRAAWEAIPRPVMSGSALGPSSNNCFGWNRREPNFNRGWVFLARECLWVEPFARVRHHPAFKEYSRRRYDDPEALDRKVMTKLMRDLALLFRSFKLESDYQDGSYADLMMLGILLEDRYLFDFAAGHQECVLYNHHYQDGMNGEGAPNYMDMVRGYYGYMADPRGWLEFDPGFLERNPFFESARTELTKLYTVRGLPLEFGDQHIRAYDGRFTIDPQQVRANEAVPSRNWPGYGIGILRVGGPGYRQEVFLTYDRVSLHGASDKLGIECWVDGVPVMREGGYANHSLSVALDAAQPEAKAMLALPYPRPMFDMRPVPGNPFPAWQFVHSHLAHNTVSVNDLGTGPGWSDNEGFGDLVTYKGGEAPGEPGSRFQVLDCRDLQSLERYSAAVLGAPGFKVPEARRTLLAVEGPEGRPYALDVARLQGGERQALYQSAWGDRVADSLPPVVSTEPDLAQHLEKLRGSGAPALHFRESYAQIRPVEVRGPAPPVWDLTWKTDYAAYAPPDPEGKPRPRPLPDGVGQVRLRLLGLGNDGALGQTGATNLLTAKGPWVAVVEQPLPGGRYASGNVAFRDAWDYLIESRTQGKGLEPLRSVYVHLLEGFREGEQSALKQVRRLPLAAGSRAAEGALGLQVDLEDGHTDTLVFQPEPGTVRVGDVSTDAAYALLRRDREGRVTEAHLVRGTRLECGKFAARTEAQFAGTVVDLIGDLTGTRQESALLVRPDAPWPLGAALAGKQLLVQVINNHHEGFTIEKVSRAEGGLVRVDLAGRPPLSSGWYQVSQLDQEHPDTLRSNRQLWAGINTPWWWGCKAWFPELDKTFALRHTGSDRQTLQVEGARNLGAEGVKPGAWFVIYAIEPGVTVSVAGDLSWRRELLRPAPMVRYSVQATGGATLSLPAERGELWLRAGRGRWRPAMPALDAERGTMALTVPAEESQGQVVSLVAGKPAWLQLEDSGPPQVAAILVDGQPQKLGPSLDLGRIPSPQRIALQVKDAENPLDEASVTVTVDGRAVEGPLVRVQPSTPDRKAAAIELDLKGALAAEPDDRPARHVVVFRADDFAVDDRATEATLTYMKLIKPEGDAVYLSDLKEVSSFVHGGLRKDCDYYGRPLRMRGALFAKCLQTHVELSGLTPHSEVVYHLSSLPPRKRLRALVGISDDSGGAGTVTFEVQVERDGRWETRYTSPVVRGGQDPLGISVDIAGAQKLRLYCTDAGDGIGSDHATWAEARLE